ncbi:MAG: hypothetical protein CMN28_08465 [Salinisphaeraceae bacterium]|nr:hypothetical protein [Salinisphaeraceae bacterium]
METDSQPELHLDPESLDPQALAPQTYHKVVSPALKVCADVAAERNDPTLAADMPSMLALVHVIEFFRELHDETDAEQEERLRQAAASACVMVLRESGLDDNATGQCLAALEAAYAQLATHDVFSSARYALTEAWDLLNQDRREPALETIKGAVVRIVMAIDAWQEKRH